VSEFDGRSPANTRPEPGTFPKLRHAKYVTFQMAEMAVPRELFTAILARIE
jgi:hypothetical protein